MRFLTNLSFLIVITALVVTQGYGQTRQKVHAIKGTIKLDGQVDELWKTTQAVLTSKLVETELKSKPENASLGRFRCLWDDQYLYILAEVKDKKIGTKSGNPWEQDSIEIFLDENKARSKGIQPDDSQYRVSATGKISTGNYALGKNIRAAAVSTSNGYRIEMAIKLNSRSPKTGQHLGIEFQVNNDHDSGKRVSLAKWNHAENDAWRNTVNYGTLIMVDELPPGISNSVPKIEPSPPPHTDSETPAENAGDASILTTRKRVPAWAKDAIFYQIFPERFRNGDVSNDPTRESLEFPEITPANWRVSNWTDEWYRRDRWEKQLGENFYDDGVFHRRYGGDLQGVLDKLDYLANLGINTIYFNPVFYARSMHKYDGNSFHHIDPHFGPDPTGDFAVMQAESADPATWKWTAADRLFLELLKEAHKRNIRVIIDGVFNHTGRDFFAFKDIVEKQKASKYVSWYMVESFDAPDTPQNEFKYKGWWGVDTLPEFADNESGDDLHPAPKSYVMTATRRWMDPNNDGDTSDGIDGWRLDVANEVPDKFWRDWNAMVRQINPDAYTVAEIWEGAGDYLRDCGFSATMNYHGFAFPVKGFLIDQKLPASRFAKLILARMSEHEPDVQYALQNLIDSHDTDRLASMIVNARRNLKYLNADRFDYDVGERVSARADQSYRVQPPDPQDRRVQQLVAMFQMTFVGAPMIYYGTEAGMDGGDDPDDRMPMYWEDLDYAARTMGPYGKLKSSFPIAFDKSVFKYYQSLTRVRSSYKSLRRGTFKFVHTNDEHGILAYRRELGDERMLVVLNRGNQEFDLDYEGLGLAGDDVLKPILLSAKPSEVDVKQSASGTVTLGKQPLANTKIKFASNESCGKPTITATDANGNFSVGRVLHLPGISGGIWKIEKE